jgi:hypothetical protein
MAGENRLQQNCIKYLESEGIYYINVHGGGWTAKGAPDLFVCINGKFVVFELKVDMNDLSAAQRLHRKRVLKSNGLHYAPRTLESFVEIVRTFSEVG